MIREILIIIFLTALVALVRTLGWHSSGIAGNEASVLFGFILLVSYLCGRLARRVRLPMITGYLLAGIFFGPHILGALGASFSGFSEQALGRLSVFNQLALGLIAISAGGELRMEVLRPRLRSILTVIAGQIGAALVIMIPAIFLAAPYFAFLSSFSRTSLIGISLLLAVLALSNSPASTIALILENRAKGPLATTTLGVTVLMDMVVIILFSLVLIAAKLLVRPEAQLDLTILGLILWEVFGSILIGYMLGRLLGLYVKHLGAGLPLIMLALSYSCMRLAGEVHLSGLLLCMVAGFTIANFTAHGQRLISSLDRFSLPIFVLFFTITGANLKLPLLFPLWPLVVLLVVLRGLVIWSGTTVGSSLAKDAETVRNNLWLGFLPQAGVTLGLAILVFESFPEIGVPLANAIVAVVAINQIIGPIAFRFGLVRSGEARPLPLK